MSFSTGFRGRLPALGYRLGTLLALLAIAGAGSSVSAQELVNGSFEESNPQGNPIAWTLQARELIAELDEAETIDGHRALKVSGSGGSAFVKQAFDLGDTGFSGATLRGHIRTRDIAPSATLVAILEGPEGRIYMDDMRDRVVAGDTEWQEYSIYIPSSKEARSLTVGALVIGSGTAWFDGLVLSQTREDATADTDTDPRTYILEALSIMRENYLHADDVDWERVREHGLRALPDNAGMAQARAAVSMMLEALDDPHVTTSRPRDSDNGGSDASEPIEHVTVERVSRGIALVHVPYVPGSTAEKARVKFADDAHRALKSIDSPDLCGWVVDLRDNTGGNMWPMIAAIGPIAGPGVLGQFKGPKGSEVTEWVYHDGAALISTGSETVERTAVTMAPFEPANPDLPVAVLVSGQTSSSGEATAIAFIGRDNTRLFGSETGGLATANNGYALSDGFRIVFPIGYMADRHGTVHYPGVLPDEEVAPDGSLERSVDWLKSQPACAH